MLKEGIISGLLSTGSDVHLAGMISTPTLAFIARHFDAGIMVTASHNPPQYNGMKFFNPDGMAFDTKQMEEIEEGIDGKKFAIANWDNIGAVAAHHGAIQEHMEAIMKQIGNGLDLKVAVDCASGVGATITPFLLRGMGCDVVTLNAQIDGHFPGRNPEPTDENLSALKKIVEETNADLGMAHDGDADRLVVVDDGKLVSNDRLLALIGRRMGINKMVVPVNASMCIDDYLAIEVKRSKVGDVFVAEEMKKCGADFGGEPSGTFIFPSFSYCPDGIYASAVIASLASKGKLADLLKEVPQYPIFRSSIPCSNRKVMEIIKEKIARFGKIQEIDGIRLVTDNGWILIRPSGTEPLIRLTTEAREEKVAREMHEKGMKILKEAIAEAKQK
jgi:phosphoglucosamine mutase